MTVLSPAATIGLCRAAGFTDDVIANMVAIAWAESGLDTTKHNTKPPDDSYSLWQINMYGPLGPARRAQWHLAKNEDLFDPMVNAKAAFDLSSGGHNLLPWSTFTSGAYKQFVPKVQAAFTSTAPKKGEPGYSTGKADPIGNVLGLGAAAAGAGGKVLSAAEQAAAATASSLASLVSIITKAGAWVANRHNWVRIIEVLTGVIAVVVGALMVSKDLGASPASIAKAAL